MVHVAVYQAFHCVGAGAICRFAEAVAVANAEGQDFDSNQITDDVRGVLVNSREGVTSIYADIRNGVRTEVDVISGFIVRTAKRLGVAVPNHEVVVELIHALEVKPGNG